jgi:hypothetical protein
MKNVPVFLLALTASYPNYDNKMEHRPEYKALNYMSM